MPKIKICGLNRIEDVKAANEFLPDYIGFVFAESRRRVNHEQAKQMSDLLDDRISKVGVFVNAKLSEIMKLSQEGIIDLIQLHGDEDNTYIDSLKNEVLQPVIKSVRVKSAEQILKMQSWSCEFLLLDTYQKDLYGGSGKVFDWSLIPNMTKPFFLAGGLNTSNVKKAISYHPYCLDFSSGVETDGVKDKSKIKEIVGIIRSEI